MKQTGQYQVYNELKHQSVVTRNTMALADNLSFLAPEAHCLLQFPWNFQSIRVVKSIFPPRKDLQIASAVCDGALIQLIRFDSRLCA